MKINLLLISLILVSKYSFADVLQETRDQEADLSSQENAMNDNLDALGTSHQALQGEIQAIEDSQAAVRQEIEALKQELEDFKNSNNNASLDELNALNKQISEKAKIYSEQQAKRHEILIEIRDLDNNLDGLIMSYCSYEGQESANYIQ